MIRILFINLFILLMSSNDLEAQVKSSKFNFVLKTILKSKTPIVYIPQAAKQAKNYLFLDAREFNEFEVSHIINARHIGYKKFDLLEISNVPKTQAVIVYCSIGKRSEDITNKMKDAGYTLRQP